jgi:hypothetical protein
VFGSETLCWSYLSCTWKRKQLQLFIWPVQFSYKHPPGRSFNISRHGMHPYLALLLISWGLACMNLWLVIQGNQKLPKPQAIASQNMLVFIWDTCFLNLYDQTCNKSMQAITRLIASCKHSSKMQIQTCSLLDSPLNTALRTTIYPFYIFYSSCTYQGVWCLPVELEVLDWIKVEGDKKWPR